MSSTIHISKVTTLNKNIELLNLAAGEVSEVVQLTADSISLEITNAFVGKGQQVTLVGEIGMGQEKFQFESIAEIVQCEVISDSVVQFQFRLQKYDQELWSQFMNSKQALQNHLDNLLQKMKG